MPPFAAYWHDLDILDRFELGLLSLSSVNSEQRRRRRTRESLQRFLRRRRRQQHGFTQTSDVALALLAYLRAGRAELLLLNLEDVWLETRSQNTPGTTSERINWQHKARFPIESWQHLSPMRLILDTLNQTAPHAARSTPNTPRRSPQPSRKLPRPIA
jgi:4-alpha-glucanotransferase